MLIMLVVALALFHAIAESRAFGRASGRERRDVFGTIPRDWLWLTGGACFVAFELLVAARSLSVSHFALPQLIGALAGTSLFVLGTSLRCRAIAALADDFVRPPFSGSPPSLVATGVFAWSRHPSELGLLLMCAGLVLIAPDWLTAAMFLLCLVPLGAIRICREERWLRADYGAAHAAYRRAVPPILPRWSSYRNVL